MLHRRFNRFVPRGAAFDAPLSLAGLPYGEAGAAQWLGAANCYGEARRIPRWSATGPVVSNVYPRTRPERHCSEPASGPCRRQTRLCDC